MFTLKSCLEVLIGYQTRLIVRKRVLYRNNNFLFNDDYQVMLVIFVCGSSTHA